MRRSGVEKGSLVVEGENKACPEQPLNSAGGGLCRRAIRSDQIMGLVFSVFVSFFLARTRSLRAVKVSVMLCCDGLE